VPAFDGSGPRGHGPMTGRGEGYCVMVLPPYQSGETPDGYAGSQGRPVHLGGQTMPRATGAYRAVRRCPPMWSWRAFGRRRARGWTRC
jgi:hypothetical protein